MHKSIVKISEDRKFSGTGFVIESDKAGSYVLTCGHVVNHENKIFVDGKESRLIRNMYKEDLDLALIYVKDMFLPALDLCDRKHSDSGFVIGYTLLNKDIKK
jgi:S1-C subfamily serine protease